MSVKEFNYRVIAAVTLLFLLAGSGAAGAVSIISEDFNTSVLDTNWTTVPGLGTYSLTANPGYLRYLSSDYYACSGSWLSNCDDGPWRHSNSTIRNFSGENWIMDSKITYHMRQRKGGFAGPQGIAIYMAFGSSKDNYVKIMRSVDYLSDSNVLGVYLENINGTPANYSNDSLRAPDDIDTNEWLNHTY